jgi:hypothetical protein
MLDYSCVYVQTTYSQPVTVVAPSTSICSSLEELATAHWSYGPARCTIQACAIPLTQTAVRDCSQELEALSPAAVRFLMSSEDTHLISCN